MARGAWLALILCAATAAAAVAAATGGAAGHRVDDGLGKSPGEECPLPNGGKGVCRRISSCPEAKKALEEGESTVICSYDEFTPVVCCATKSIAKRMCAVYGEAVFRYETVPTIIPQTLKIDQCARQLPRPTRVRRVAGGEKAGLNEFPHMARLGYGTSLQNPSPWICGGSLISNRYVLTVAHCIVNERQKPKFVRLGDLDVKSTEESQHRDYEIDAIIAHPNFKVGVFYHNIGLLRLAEEVIFTESIRPACLHTQTEIVGEPFVTGWGFTELGATSDHLMKLKLPILKPEVCQKEYQTLTSTNSLQNGIDDASMICAGTMVPSKETCKGDSGGPLQVELKTPYCMHSVVGITSFGKNSCGGSTAVANVFTRVSHYVPWIEGIVWPDEA